MMSVVGDVDHPQSRMLVPMTGENDCSVGVHDVHSVVVVVRSHAVVAQHADGDERAGQLWKEISMARREWKMWEVEKC